MNKKQNNRQRTRKALLIISFLFFPIIMNYMSPYVIIDGASQGIVNGSLVVFAVMFLTSLVLGRLWCGWVCPMGGLAEIAFAANNRPVNGKKIDWIKWAIWFPWLAIIVWAAASAGGYRQVNFSLDTVGGISVAGDADRPILAAYIIYYLVVGLFLALSIFVGKRAGCHTICWMAPFMVLGRKIRNLFGWPSLRLVADPGQCTSCKTCTAGCPMSLDVNGMVQLKAMENSECILCGSCVDGCSKNAIRYSFSSGK
jgi:ferredoxin-type protein NapH